MGIKIELPLLRLNDIAQREFYENRYDWFQKNMHNYYDVRHDNLNHRWTVEFENIEDALWIWIVWT